MELNWIDRFFLKALYLTAMGIVIMQTLGQSSLTSLLFTMTFPLTVFLWLRSVRKTVTEEDVLLILAVALAVICVLLDAAIHTASLSFSYLRKVVMFSITLLFFQTSYRMRLDRDMVQFITRVVDCLVLYLAIMYFARPYQMHMFSGRISNYLTFRIGNPNLTGMFLACLYALELYRVFSREKITFKLFRIAMAIFLVVCIFLTRSRNALMVVLIFTAVCLWLIFRGFKKMKISKPVAILIALLPAAFVAGYLIVVYTPWFNNILAFLVGEGKNLDSRVDIWQPAVVEFLRSPLIGSFYTITKGMGNAQMHNSHLDIAASYGILVLTLVCVLLFRYLNQNGRCYNTKEKYICILGFASVLMLGIGEAGLFAGGLGLYIFVGTFLILAGQEDKRIAEVM